MTRPYITPEGLSGITITQREQIPLAIAHLEQMGEPACFRVPLLQGLHRGRIGYLDVHGGSPSRTVKAFLAQVRLPAVVTVADDFDNPAGPDKIPQLGRLVRWARFCIIHGTGGTREQYEALVGITLVAGRVLMIECGSDRITDYRIAAERHGFKGAMQILQPLRGGIHPVQRPAGSVH